LPDCPIANYPITRLPDDPEEFHVKRLSSIGKAVILLALAGSAAPAYAQGVTLRYKWTKGEARTYRMTTQTDSVITGMPGGAGTMTMAQTMTQVLKLTAEEVAPDGTATLRQTFQSVRMESNGPMGKVVFDSASFENGDSPMVQSMRQVLGAMIGESVLIEMAADGTVRKVDGASRIADKITRVIAADPAAGAAGQGIKSMLSDDALKGTLEQSFPKLPPGPARTGDTWTSQLAIGNQVMGRILGESTFTLKAPEGTGDAPLARIGVHLALKQEVVPPPSGPAGMVMTLGDARGEGEIVFDVARGHIQRSTMRSDLPSSVTMNTPEGTVTTMNNKTTTTVTMALVER
jgi:hypothetical protein